MWPGSFVSACSNAHYMHPARVVAQSMDINAYNTSRLNMMICLLHDQSDGCQRQNPEQHHFRTPNSDEVSKPLIAQRSTLSAESRLSLIQGGEPSASDCPERSESGTCQAGRGPYGSGIASETDAAGSVETAVAEAVSEPDAV